MKKETNEELQKEFARLAKSMLDKMSVLKIIPPEELSIVYKDLSDMENRRNDIKSELKKRDSNSKNCGYS